MKIKRFACIVMSLLCCGVAASGCAEAKNPIATFEIEGFGSIKMELYPKVAPNTVANFVTLINDGFYDGLNFHRAEPGFVIQGGSPYGDGTGGPGWTITGEVLNNNFQNDLKHTRGVLSMARGGSLDSAGSQFFIMLADIKSLDGAYAAFGKVIDEESMAVVDAIAALPTVANGQLNYITNPPIIKQATVETFGTTYKVKKIE